MDTSSPQPNRDPALRWAPCTGWLCLALVLLGIVLPPLPTKAGLDEYDAAVDRDATLGRRPVSRSTTLITLTGRARVPWDFGAIARDATFEFILEGDPNTQGAYLAVGANTGSNLRFAQWPNTRQLGFTQLGVADYQFTPAVGSPTAPTHIAYVWSAAQRTMRLYHGGVLVGTASGIAPGFAMPSGAGWLGSNPGGTEAMTGILHRLTAYDGVLPEETIRSHAQAWAGLQPLPVIRSFTADRVYFATGDAVTLSWRGEGAERVRLDPQPGDVTSLTQDGAGSFTFQPADALALVLTLTNTFGSETATVHLHRTLAASHPVIAEIMARDRSTLADEDGEHTGWIEIHNPTGTPISLNGATLSDDPSDLGKWVFPALELAAHESLVVFASGKNRASERAALHTNFRLKNSGEFLALTGPGAVWQHAFRPTYPALADEVAYGLRGGDPRTAGILPNPTPGRPNPGAATPPPGVEIAPGAGTFTNTLVLVLSHPNPTAEIRYTLDGSDPSDSRAARYTAPLSLTNSTRLRTLAKMQGLASPLRGASYLRLAPDLAAYSSTLPLLIIENFGAGPIPRKGWNSTGAGLRQVPRQAATWATFERTNGIARTTQPPQLISPVGIRGRGAYSSEWRQKPYSVEALDEAGNETDVSPLGMPEHSDWVLYYPDPEASRDPTLLFNTFAYDLSRAFGQYSVRFRWVEAFINEDGGPLSLADRRGVYAIVERVARGRDRLDFTRLSADGTQGGWLLNINRMDPEPEGGWPAANGATRPWFFHTAGPDGVLQTSPNTAYGQVPGDDEPQQPNAYINFDNPNGYVISPIQRAAIEGWFRQFEQVLYDDALWRDPVRGYRRFVESQNFIDYFILNTLTKNGDGLLISIFPWKGDDDRLRIGPAWDYNWAAYYVSGEATGSLLHRAERLWYPRLFADPDFAQDYLDRWWELRAGPLAPAAMDAIVNRQAAEISPAKAQLNGMPSATEWTRRLNQLKSWLKQRAAWIDTQYLAPPHAVPAVGEVPPGSLITLTATAGTLYYTTDDRDPRAAGGSPSATARVYSSPIPISSATRLKARLRQGTRWSGLLTTQYTLPQDFTPLRLSELMYHPVAFEAWPETDLEFVELRNTGARELDLSGLAFTAGIGFSFSNGTRLEPGAHLVLARQPEALRAQHPGLKVHGAFSGQLENAGELLQLTDAQSNVVLRVTYDDRAPWPVAADGAGRSLVPREDGHASADPASPAHWRASTEVGGSPGLEDPPFIVLHPLSQSVVPGQPITLSLAVHPSASLPLHVRWRRHEVDLDVAPGLVPGPYAFLPVPRALPPDALYQAIVANAEHPDGLPTRTATVAFVADTDADGLPDAWETAHGFDPGQAQDAGLDSDADGARDLVEYLAGTHPTDPRSALRLEDVQSLETSGLGFQFEAQATRTYAIQSTPSLHLPDWTVVAEFPAENAPRRHRVRLEAQSSARFLRIVTPRP